MVGRSQTGEVAVYPVVETEQIEQICRRVIAPARVSEKVTNEVGAIATQLVTQLGVVGILGIELFLTRTGQVFINEIATQEAKGVIIKIKTDFLIDFEDALLNQLE